MATLAEMFGADCATPYESVGAYCAGGPVAIRRASAVDAGSLTHMNFGLGGPVFPEGTGAVDAGDLAQVPDDAAGNRRRIAQAVGQALDRGAVSSADRGR